MSGFVMDNMILVCLKLVETSAFCGEHAAEQVDQGCNDRCRICDRSLTQNLDYIMAVGKDGLTLTR